MYNGHHRRGSRGYTPVTDRNFAHHSRTQPPESPNAARIGHYYNRYPADTNDLGEYANTYQESNGWRNDRGYYSYERSPSPERYDYYRATDSEQWPQWDYREPIAPVIPQWPEPPRSGWTRPRRESAPVFEPSESWKAAHKEEATKNQTPDMNRARDLRGFSPPERSPVRYQETLVAYDGNYRSTERTWEEAHSSPQSHPSPQSRFHGRSNSYGSHSRQRTAASGSRADQTDRRARDVQGHGKRQSKNDFEDSRSNGDHRTSVAFHRSPPSHGRPDLSFRARSLSHSEQLSIASSVNSRNMSPSGSHNSWKPSRARSRSPMVDVARSRLSDTPAITSRVVFDSQPPDDTTSAPGSGADTPPGLGLSASKPMTHVPHAWKERVLSPRPPTLIPTSWDRPLQPSLLSDGVGSMHQDGMGDRSAQELKAPSTPPPTTNILKPASSPERKQGVLSQDLSPLIITELARDSTLSAKPATSPHTETASQDGLYLTKPSVSSSSVVAQSLSLAEFSEHDGRREPKLVLEVDSETCLPVSPGIVKAANASDAHNLNGTASSPPPLGVMEDIVFTPPSERLAPTAIAVPMADSEPAHGLSAVVDAEESVPALPLDAAAAMSPHLAPVTHADIVQNAEQQPEPTTAKDMVDALRVAVRQRALYDHQSREERVEPILIANKLRVEARSLYPEQEQTDVVLEVMEKWEHEDDDVLANIRAHLKSRLMHDDKLHELHVQRLQEEYLTWHESWVVNCARLDDQDAVRVSSPSLQEESTLPAGGRTTRRSAVTQSDAVRSDFEMQQIIENLGHEDMTDPTHLAARNIATIPDMISVVRVNKQCIFDDTNNLVVSPHEFYKPRTGLLDWTAEEQEILKRKFAAHPKQFGHIAAGLEHKTTRQCVAFYYLHKKTGIDFRKVTAEYAPNKRRRGGRRADKQKGNALLTDIRKHDEEVSAGRSTRTRKPRIPVQETPTPTPEPEAELKQRKRRTARATLVEIDVGDEDGAIQPKKAKRGRKPKVVTASAETNTSGRKKTGHSTTWTEDIDGRGSPLSDVDYRMGDSTIISARDTHSETLDNRSFRHYQPVVSDGSVPLSSSSQDQLPLSTAFTGQMEPVPMHHPGQMFPFGSFPSFGYGQPPGWPDMRTASAMAFPHNPAGITADRTNPYNQSTPVTPVAGHSGPPNGFLSFPREAFAFASRPMMPPSNMPISWIGQTTFAPPPGLGSMYQPTGPPQHFDYVNSATMHQTMPSRPPMTGGPRWSEEESRSYDQ